MANSQGGSRCADPTATSRPDDTQCSDGLQSSPSCPGYSAPASVGFGLLLLAVALAGASQTATLALLPEVVNSSKSIGRVTSHDLHIVFLSALFPLVAFLLAPIWGWLADKNDYRAILRVALVVLAAATFFFRSGSLIELYLARTAAGMAAAAIIPLALLSGSLGASDPRDQANRFTWLTAFVFVGDLAGPLIARFSASILPAHPLTLLAGGIAIASVLLAIRPLPPRLEWCAALRRNRSLPLRTTFALLAVTTLGGAGLAVLHINLLLVHDAAGRGGDLVAVLLSLCGVGMLAAQLLQARTGWLVARPRGTTQAMTLLLAAAMLISALPSPGLSIALGLPVLLVGWSAASLRLVASFWLGGTGSVPSGLRLGWQHSATSVGQALVPLGLLAMPQRSPTELTIALALGMVLLAMLLPVTWPLGVTKIGQAPRGLGSSRA